jgi:hypothetical protein
MDEGKRKFNRLNLVNIDLLQLTFVFVIKYSIKDLESAVFNFLINTALYMFKDIYLNIVFMTTIYL